MYLELLDVGLVALCLIAIIFVRPRLSALLAGSPGESSSVTVTPADPDKR